MIRLLFILAMLGMAVAVVIAIVKLLQPSGSFRCTRCDGRGFWLGARGRERCDWCKGTGRLPKDFQ